MGFEKGLNRAPTDKDVLVTSQTVEDKLHWLIVEKNLGKHHLMEAAHSLLSHAPHYREVLEKVIAARPKEASEEAMPARYSASSSN